VTIATVEIYQALLAALLPFVRIAAFVSVAPILGYGGVPARIRLTVAIALAMVIIPVVGDFSMLSTVPSDVDEPNIDDGVDIRALFTQTLIGLALGFALRLALAVMELAGQLIANLMGLGFASFVDPQNGIDVPIVSQLFVIMALLVFLSINGHLIVVNVLIDSFRVLPATSFPDGWESLWRISGQLGWVFSAAVVIALPAIVTLLIVNIAFGVVSRAAPQLHIIVIGFPTTLIFGLVILWIGATDIANNIPGVWERAFDVTAFILGDQ
jgi:flagellar biosynthetic protein FliR